MSQPPPPPPPPPEGAGQDPYTSQQGYSQPAVQPGYPGYPQAYAAPRKPIDFAKILFIAAWVVLGLFGLAYFYVLTQSERDTGMDFADRFFGSMPQLGTGILYAGILLAVSKWYEKQQQGG